LLTHAVAIPPPVDDVVVLYHDVLDMLMYSIEKINVKYGCVPLFPTVISFFHFRINITSISHHMACYLLFSPLAMCVYDLAMCMYDQQLDVGLCGSGPV
jgi:hypothetical protein